MTPPQCQPPDDNNESTRIKRLIELINTLTAEDGCPWDQKQTPESLSVYLTEEVHELAQAIQTGNSHDMCEELGDAIFLIMFIAERCEKAGLFDISAAIDAVCDKMVRRHPHVFENKPMTSVGDIRKQWRKIKKTEKTGEQKASVLDSVPAGLPALMRAYRVSERAAGAGFDWDDMAGVLKKTDEEINEFKTALDERDEHKIHSEFGDILFTLVNVARFAGIHPETALYDAVNKFEKRFQYMEKEILKDGREIESLSHDALEALWEKAKHMV